MKPASSNNKYCSIFPSVFGYIKLLHLPQKMNQAVLFYDDANCNHSNYSSQLKKLLKYFANIGSFECF